VGAAPETTLAVALLESNTQSQALCVSYPVPKSASHPLLVGNSSQNSLLEVDV
jgi:hypothetical protein